MSMSMSMSNNKIYPNIELVPKNIVAENVCGVQFLTILPENYVAVIPNEMIEREQLHSSNSSVTTQTEIEYETDDANVGDSLMKRVFICLLLSFLLLVLPIILIVTLSPSSNNSYHINLNNLNITMS